MVEPLLFLTRIARLRMAPDAIAWTVRQASAIEDWPAVLDLAEHHGVGALLWAHLHAVFDLPPDARKRLYADLIRQRRKNELRFTVLGEILDVFADAGIRVVLLKGAVLAPLVYDDLGQRPMNDLDLLVHEDMVGSAQRLLGTLGFTTPEPQVVPHHHHHLPVARRWADGVPIQVEIHRNAVHRDRGSLRLDQVSSDLLTLTVAGRRAHSLPPTELLVNVCYHALSPQNELRLISVADILGCVDRFEALVDWDRIARTHPFVLRTLELLSCLLASADGGPHSRNLPADRRLRGFGQRYEGWPARSVRNLRGRERLRVAARTLSPSEWWLRITYGAGPSAAGLWQAWARHAGYLAWALADACGRLATERFRDAGGASSGRARYSLE